MSGSNGQPYLSVVVTARNDDHGGNLRGRMQAFVSGLINQCRRHRLAAELVMVEWNPPPDRPKLAEALHWPEDEGWCPVRIIEVGPELHRRWGSWQALPLFQMIGKNVGIRRARGEFVLATNIDVLFTDELIRFFAERRMEPDKMYRVDRWDAMSDLPANGTLDEQLEYCRTHLIRLNAREGTFRVDGDGLRLLDTPDILSQESSMKLGSGWFQRELSGEYPFRWVENDAELILPGSKESRTLVVDVEPGPGVGMGPFALDLKDEAGEKIATAIIDQRAVVTFTIPPAPAGNTGTTRVRFYTRHGGEPLESDLRILNFRIFECHIETGSAGAAAKETAAKVRTVVSRASRLRRGWRLAREIWRGNPDVQIRVPMSRERLARLDLRKDGTGISFSAQALRAENSGQLLPAGMRALWGSGWHPVEYFAGETFRWMGPRAGVVWMLPRDAPPAFELEVEPGPAVGFQPCTLEIRDQWDELIAAHPVKGRTRVVIPTTSFQGPLVSSLRVTGGGPAKTVRSESRVLALRVIDCRWAGGEAESGYVPARELTSVGAGIWTLAGWDKAGDPQMRGLAALPGAQLLVRVPDERTRALALEVAPIGKDKTVHLVVEDSLGKTLYRGLIDSHQRIRLDGRFEGGNNYALRLVDGSVSGAPAKDEPWLRLSAIEWLEVEGQTPDAVRIAIKSSRGIQPLSIHTNACGDFTLLSRERWLSLRGYPEMDVYTMNLDSLFCWTALHAGAKEVELKDPMRVYHIEHGSGWTPEGEKKLFDRLASKGVSWLEYREVLDMARMMHRFNSPMIFNLDDWGLGKEELKETMPRAVAARA